VILPKRNEGDLEDVPEIVRQKMAFVFAERVDDVIKTALVMRPAVQGVTPLDAV
jgi:ATP-dependent Lon protease